MIPPVRLDSNHHEATCIPTAGIGRSGVDRSQPQVCTLQRVFVRFTGDEEDMMLELTVDEAAALRDLLRQRVTELDREINRTDRLEFKRELQELDRMMERILERLSTTIADAPPA